MNTRQLANGPPRNGSAPASAKARGAGTSHHTSEENTAHPAQAQVLSVTRAALGTLPNATLAEVDDSLRTARQVGLNTTCKAVGAARAAKGERALATNANATDSRVDRPMGCAVDGRPRKPVRAAKRQAMTGLNAASPAVAEVLFNNTSAMGLDAAAVVRPANDLVMGRPRKHAFARKNHQVASDPWFDPIRDHLAGAAALCDQVTVRELQSAVLGLDPAELNSQGRESQRVGRILFSLGWTKVRAGVAVRSWQWARPPVGGLCRSGICAASAWPQMIADYLDAPDRELRLETSVGEILAECLGFDLQRTHRQGGHAQRVGAILRSLGWLKVRVNSTKRTWRWVRPQLELAAA